MNEQGQISLIVDLLKHDIFLGDLISAALPQAILMPFAHEREKHYVMIALFFAEEVLKKNSLAHICKHVLKILKENNLLSGLDGVEIMACLVAEGKTERLFRLSVLSHALPKAEQLETEDFEKEEPAEGITCLFYRRIIS